MKELNILKQLIEIPLANGLNYPRPMHHYCFSLQEITLIQLMGLNLSFLVW